MAHPERRFARPTQRLALVWSTLLLLTLFSYYGLTQVSGKGFVLLVLALMLLKGQLLVDHFIGQEGLGAGLFHAQQHFAVAGGEGPV